jgi:hypothetical protein
MPSKLSPPAPPTPTPPSEQPLTILAYLSILEGALAAQAGKPASANPYGLASEQGCRWHAGWLDAGNETKDGTPDYSRIVFSEFTPPPGSGAEPPKRNPP